ncbi:helix-turn-helix domain-containing protein [Shewanella algae]|uniref:helix-turn-helix domain-containing protein n=1 Tax=Shewanella algae TaxID=38313 RepID=UPI001C5947C0|nr:helix-turn-helix transcriptional regulator [Shewanella algae]
MTEKIEQTSYSAVMGAVVSSIRKEKGIEQADVAQRMGLSQASYSRLEGGKATYSVDQVFLVAQALQVEPAELFQRVCTTVGKLKAEEFDVIAQQRSNATGSQGTSVGTLVAGAALGALLVGLLSKSK